MLKARPAPATSSSARTSSTWSRRWSGGPPSGRTSSPTPRRCASGWSSTSRPGRPTRELKLGQGGLRDVEFSVQLLQLVHGRVDERLRNPGDAAGAEGAGRQRVRRPRGRQEPRPVVPLPAVRWSIGSSCYNLRRTHLLPEAEEDLRRIGRSLGYADPAARVQSTWRSCTQRVRIAARAALLLTAARRGGPDPDLGAAADHRRRDRPAAGAGVRRPDRRAAAHRRAEPGGDAAGGDPASAAAGDARLVRGRLEPGRRAAGVPAGVGGARQYPVVSPGAPRRGRDGRAAGPDPGLQPVRGVAAHPGPADRPDAGRRRRAAAPVAGRPRGRDARRGRPAGEPGGRGGGDPGDPAP